MLLNTNVQQHATHSSTPLESTLRAILQESEANLEMKNFNPPSIFVWR